MLSFESYVILWTLLISGKPLSSHTKKLFLMTLPDSYYDINIGLIYSGVFFGISWILVLVVAVPCIVL